MTERSSTQSSIFERLVRQGGEARARLSAPMAPPAAGPRVGDLWILPSGTKLDDQTDTPIEWAVLEVEPQGALLLIPVDTCPMQGRADVLADDARVLRCGQGCWIDPAAFASGFRSGSLTREQVQAARQRRRDLRDGSAAAPLVVLETEKDPEYRQLLGRIEAIRLELEDAFREPTADSAFASKTAKATDSSREARRWFPAVAAASLLAAASIIVIHQKSVIDDLERTTAAPIPNPPVVWLEPGNDRGSREVGAVAEGTPYIVLLLIPEVTGHVQQSYSLKIFAHGDDRPLWNGEMAGGALPELFVLLPTRHFPAGDYHLQLTAREGDLERSAGTYELRILQSP
ncbi:MAG: hypothetical protein AAF604_17235 [Acidobacteriota bacterium]